MKCIAWFSNIFLFTLLLISACTDPTEIGADLLEGDEAEVGFTDTFTVRATTLKTDTILSYFPVKASSEAYSSYLLGNMQDPLFGTSTAQIYAQLALRNSVASIDASARFDSIVLVLPYDSTGVYGDLTETYGIAVHRLTQYIDPEQKYYTNVSFPSEAVPLGTKAFVPTLDSVTIYDYVGRTRDTLKVPSQIRITLNRSLGEELLKLDTTTYSRDSLLVSYLKGLHLKPTTTNRGMLSFNLTDVRAGIFLYYTEKDTIQAQLQFNFDPIWTRAVRLDHNYNNTLVQRYIGDTQLGDSLVFVQGMAGVFAEIEIPYTEKLQGLVVNKAELELRIASPPNNDGNIFEPLPLLLLLSPNDKGEFEAIDDISLILSRLGISRLKEYYGGTPVAGSPGEPQLYRINLSTHFQKIINKTRTGVLRLVAFNRLQEPGRVVLFGAKDPQYAIKLKVAFTRPPGK